MSGKKDELTERLLKCLDELEECKRDRDNCKSYWIDSLQELSEIEDAFEADEKDKLHGKTILDVGTDCVKPLYIALKYEPSKIIGIDEELVSFASDVEQESKHFTETKIHFHNCSLFCDENLKKIREEEKIKEFDLVLVSKTLHHLRTGECVVKEHNKEHDPRKDEKYCINRFVTEDVFDLLLGLGKRVIVYEYFNPTQEDDDKVRGRGGYFTTMEWKRIFQHLLKKYKVEFFRPVRCSLDKNNFIKVIAKLRQVDYIGFYVETK